jgi:hypothetical protein
MSGDRSIPIVELSLVRVGGPQRFRMRRLVAILLLLTIAPRDIVAASDAVHITDAETKASPGKSVAITTRSPARFAAYSRAKISFGLIGIAAAAHAGKKIIDENGVENSAPQIATALFEAARNRYGVTAARLAPLAVESTDPAMIARAGRGADIIFDVQPMGGSIEPLLTQPGKYFVTSEFRFRVIDVASGHVLGDETCVRTTQTQPDLPTYDELMRDHAAHLKMILGGQRDFCVEYFGTQVLGLQLP